MISNDGFARRSTRAQQPPVNGMAGRFRQQSLARMRPASAADASFCQSAKNNAQLSVMCRRDTDLFYFMPAPVAISRGFTR